MSLLNTKAKPKIVIHDPRLSIEIGGGETVTLGLAKLLSNAGYQLTIVTQAGNRSDLFSSFVGNNPKIGIKEFCIDDFGNAPQHNLKDLWNSDRLAPQSLAFGIMTQAYYREQKFDLMIISLIIDLATVEASCPVMLNVFGLPPDTEIARLESPLLKKVGTMTFASDYVRKEFAKLFNLPHPESCGNVVSAGINDIFYSPQPNIKKVFDLCFAGRLIPRKGVEVIINALGVISQNKGERPNLVVAGCGSAGPDLKALARDIGVFDQILWLGAVKPLELRVIMDQSRIFVYPTILPEAFGCSNVEAMARGLPVIATWFGGVRDYLIPGVNGCVCEPNNPASLAEVVCSLLGSFDMRCRIGMNGRKTADRYRMGVVQQSWLRCVADILA